MRFFSWHGLARVVGRRLPSAPWNPSGEPAGTGPALERLRRMILKIPGCAAEIKLFGDAVEVGRCVAKTLRVLRDPGEAISNLICEAI